MDNRNYILDRLTSKKTSIEEFNFDTLQAPPLSMFLSPYDIQQLNYIARSLKYAAKPEIRYQEIDKIMRSRGLVKFAAGTNRVVYRHPEFQDILFKIAADDVGLGDNPAEYRNQFLLKPFVAKTFEISPCGTVALVERCSPITNREEYISVADDIFELINEWLIGEYVLADIGSKFFANTAIRKGFGIVLIDYPYVYKLDGNKLFCNRPEPTNPSGKCEGIIDYDDGYNFLRCTKCGAIYKAKELEQKISSNELIVKRKGETKMKITLSGGTNNSGKKVINTGEATSTPFGDPVSKIKVTTSPAVNPVKEDPTKKENNIDTKVSIDDSNVVKEENIDMNINKSVNGVSAEPAKKKNPITISDNIREEAITEAASKSVVKDPVNKIGELLKEIKNLVDMIDIDTVKNNTVDNIMNFTTSLFNNDTDLATSLSNTLINVIDEASDEDYMNILSNENLVSSIFKRFYLPKFVVTNVEKDGKDILIDYDCNITCAFDEDESECGVLCTIQDNKYTLVVNNAMSMFVDEEDHDEVSPSEDKECKTYPEVVSEGGEYRGIKLYNSVIRMTNEIDPSCEDENSVLLPVDNNGNYLTTEEQLIIAINVIDDSNLDDIAIVSKDFFKNAVKQLNFNTEEVPDSVIDETAEKVEI